MWNRIRLAALLVLVAMAPVGAAGPADVLTRHGVEPTAAGVLVFLRQYKPDADSRVRIAGAIAQLGSDNFEAREAARRQLENWGAAAVAPLRDAAEGDDPEAASRARQLLSEWERGERRKVNGELLTAATSWLRRSPAPGAAPVLLDVLPALPDVWDREAAAEALWACARPEDAPRLRAAIDAGGVAVRAAAIPALEAVTADGAVGALRPFLADKDERTRLAAARALAERLPRESVTALLDLLASRDPGVRLQAAWLLQQLSGIPTEAESDADLDASAKRWQAWAATADGRRRNAVGGGRLRVGRYAVFLSESFAEAAAEVRGSYGRFRYESDAGGAASVKDGVLRFDGNHPDGDQRLYVTPDALLGLPEFPRRFRIKATLGGEADEAGAWHVGVSLGNVRLLFHPAYTGGAFRAERVDNRQALFNNESMPFTPAAGVLHEMTIDVERLDGGDARLDVTVADGAGGAGGAAGKPFARGVKCQAAEIGDLRRIALERSGRTGGGALFGRLTIRAIPSDAE